MPTFHFCNTAGNLVTVTAPDEATARRDAMTELHGEAPQFIGTPPTYIKAWIGRGLDLQSVEGA